MRRRGETIGAGARPAAIMSPMLAAPAGRSREEFHGRRSEDHKGMAGEMPIAGEEVEECRKLPRRAERVQPRDQPPPPPRLVRTRSLFPI